MKTLCFDPTKLTMIRYKLKLSLEDFAHLCGCDIASMHRYETGKTQPRFPYFLKIFCAVQELNPDIKFTDFLSEEIPVTNLSASVRKRKRGKQRSHSESESDWKTSRQSV